MVSLTIFLYMYLKFFTHVLEIKLIDIGTLNAIQPYWLGGDQLFLVLGYDYNFVFVYHIVLGRYIVGFLANK